MVVGTLRLTLTLFESATLKNKRGIIRHLCDRVSNRFNVTVAEVDSLDLVGTATIGIACLSNAEPHAHAQLMKVLRFIEAFALDAEISDVETEIIHL